MGARLDTITLKDPTRFEDPFKMNYNKYVKTQYERVRLHETVSGPHKDPRNDRDLDPEYRKYAIPMAAISHYGEYSASVYCQKAAHLSPFRAFREACLFQAMDELRHSQMDWGRLKDLGVKDSYEVGKIWRSEGYCAVKDAFDWIVGLEDAFQIIFTANFVIEGAGAVSYFPNMVKLAEQNGDHIFSVINWTRFQDEVRHVAFARAMVKAIVEDDERNVKILEQWQEAAFENLGPGIGQVMGYQDLVPEPYLTSGEWMVAALSHYAEHSMKHGLELPDLDALYEGAADLPVSYEALMTERSDASLSWWEDGTPGAGALDQPSHKGAMRESEALEGVNHGGEH